MSRSQAQIWSTHAFSSRRQFNAWGDKLDEIYGLGSSWDMDIPRQDEFSASIAHYTLRDFHLVDCHCDPCGAVRVQPPTHRHHCDVLAIQLTLSGQEVMTIGDEQVELSAGDILAWDASQDIRFDVLSPLHKVTVMMPLGRLKSWMPKAWQLSNRKFACGSVQAELLSSYINAIQPGFMRGYLTNVDGLTEATVGLLTNALDDSRGMQQASLHDAQMARVQSFIERNLCEPDLSPAMIAAACRISVRYLHLLFESIGITVLQFIIQQRLLLCRRELSNPRMASRSITSIALSFGFSSATHFSRRFKAEFGMTPQDYRAQRLAETPGLTPMHPNMATMRAAVSK